MHMWEASLCHQPLRLGRSAHCKTPDGPAAAGVRVLRAAVLAAVARERPGDPEPLALARSHFGCAREAAADLLRGAQARAARCPGSAPARPLLARLRLRRRHGVC
jgi:hypothetical protein